MGARPDEPRGTHPQHSASQNQTFPTYRGSPVFIVDRPLAAVLAALATSGLVVMLDLLLRYAGR